MSKSKDTKLSICLVSDDFIPAATGVGIHLQCISKALVQRGFRVTLVTSRRGNQPVEEIWEGVQIYRVRSARIFGFYQGLPSKKALRKIFQDNQINLVHLHYLGFMLIRTASVAREMKLPLVYTYHMTAEHLTQLWVMRPFRSLIEKMIFKFCSQVALILSPSEKLTGRILATGIRTPTITLTNPVAFEGVSSQQEEMFPSRRSDFGEDFQILFAGRLSAEKNISLLLKAYAVFCQNHPSSLLWIAGEGPCEKTLREECRRLGISSRVHFLGFLDHPTLAKYYQSCDVFVLPSVWETQGLVVMEAMAFGKPTIVTDQIVSAGELVEDKVTGFIVDAFSPEPLACRLLELALNPALGLKMGIGAKTKSQTFRIDPVIDSLQSIYESTFSNHDHDQNKK